MTINSRVSKLEKALAGAGQYINVWGTAIPKAELSTEVQRIKTLVQIARGFISKATPGELSKAPHYETIYPVPGYIRTICERAKIIEGYRQLE